MAKLVDWRAANVHVLTHGLHYASSVFEGERAYGGGSSCRASIRERLHFSAGEARFPHPLHRRRDRGRKYEVLEANGLSDAYVRAVAWRGAGEDMGVASAATRCAGHRGLDVGQLLRRCQDEGREARHREVEAPLARDDPVHAKAAGLYMICTMSKHAAEAKGCSDALFMDYRGYVAEATGANIFFVKDGEVHTPKPDCFLNGLTRQTVIGCWKGRGSPGARTPHHAGRTGRLRAVLADRHRGRGHAVGQIGDYTFEVGALTRDIAQRYEALVRGVIIRFTGRAKRPAGAQGNYRERPPMPRAVYSGRRALPGCFTGPDMTERSSPCCSWTALFSSTIRGEASLDLVLAGVELSTIPQVPCPAPTARRFRSCTSCGSSSAR